MSNRSTTIHVQKKSGFDWSHHNALTQKVGTITPVFCNEVIPNTTINLRFALAGSLPPLAVDTYMKCFYDVRAFFIPFRLLAGGFESWFSDYEYPIISSTADGSNQVSSAKSFLPVLNFAADCNIVACLGNGTLADYLGFKLPNNDAGGYDDSFNLTAMPFLAYHRVCNDWFRQANITKEYFARPSTLGDGLSFNTMEQDYAVALCPYVAPAALIDAVIPVTSSYTDSCLKLADGVSLLSLRQANYDYDYFTNALPSAQLGTAMSVSSTSSFTIQSLRYANALQQFAELNQMAGMDTVSVVKARYGANLSRGVAQKCIYLGGARLDVGTKSVDVQSQSNVSSQNPFIGSVGASAGKAYVQGSDVIIDEFTALEPGYIMIVGTLIPKVTYGSGVRRYLRHYISPGSLTDMANPLLQNVGNQPIYDYELTSSLGFTNQEDVFGYTDRYGEFMQMIDEVHGLMARGKSLDAFVAQRYFYQDSSPVIGSDFLAISTQALYNVTAVSNQISNFGFYGQFAFDCKVSMPLAQYSLPSLQNPAYEHGIPVQITRGGFRF